MSLNLARGLWRAQRSGAGSSKCRVRGGVGSALADRLCGDEDPQVDRRQDAPDNLGWIGAGRKLAARDQRCRF
jgi:hypothetical protein